MPKTRALAVLVPLIVACSIALLLMGCKPKAAVALGREFSCRATAVDGDTIKCQGVRIRIWGIQAVERGQYGYEAAKTSMKRVISDERVRCVRKTPNDKYGRIVAQCYVRGRDIAELQVRRRAAKDWPRYSGGYYKRYERWF